MILQTSSLTGGVVGVVFAVLVAVIIYFKSITVVPFNEIHVISKGNRVNTFDGKGRYMYFPFIHSRTIIPKHVLDIEPGLLDLHDCDNLPFGVEISVKVQVTDPQKAAATLTQINHTTVAKVVEDTVMSAARSLAMERTILDIMKKREDIEKAVYNMVADALSKLGLSAIIFDIKNIRDMQDTEVIRTLERVKIAELRKNARISEAIQNNEAIEVEVEREQKSKVKIEQMKEKEEDARLKREQTIAKQQRILEDEKLNIEEQRTKRQAEMEGQRASILAEAERQRKLIEAKAQAESIEIEAKAQSESIKLKSAAEADGIRQKGYAEADILQKKAEVLKEGTVAAQLKILEILSQAQVASAGKIASALGENNKIMYMPMDGEGNFLTGLIPKLDAVNQSGILGDVLSNLGLGGLGSKPKSTKKTSKTE